MRPWSEHRERQSSPRSLSRRCPTCADPDNRRGESPVVRQLRFRVKPLLDHTRLHTFARLETLETSVDVTDLSVSMSGAARPNRALSATVVPVRQVRAGSYMAFR
jgi:hypothetical protein